VKRVVFDDILKLVLEVILEVREDLFVGMNLIRHSVHDLSM
jgi:hypothetical protein